MDRRSARRTFGPVRDRGFRSRLVEEALDQAAAGGSYWDAVVFSITLGLFPAAAAAIAGWLVPPKPRKLVDVLLFGSLAGVIGGVPALIWLAAASLF